MAQRIPVRHPRIDLSQGFAPHWLGDDAFRSQLFNAFSMSFPIGEKYFIDTVREALPSIEDARLREDIRGFCGQEAVHSALHRQFNAVLEKQGLRNIIERLAGWRIRRSERFTLHSRLAIVMAYEHFTAVFGDALLRDIGWLSGARPPMRLLWTWHALEESEHKAVAFDTYLALGGGYPRRVGWFLYVSLVMGIDTAVQTLLNLHHSHRLFRWNTWRSATTFLFGRRGALLHTLPHWLAYLKPGFHPRQNDTDALVRDWLERNAEAFR
ncbi:metal-dependent hydrolase [Endothiovibrio diazotrophicus]